MVILKFKLSEDEYFNYNYYTAWAAPEKKLYRLKYFLRVFLLYGAVAALYIFTNHSHVLRIDLTIFTVIGIIYFLLVPFFIRRSIKRRVKDILSLPENEHVLDEAEIVLTDTSIIDKDKVSESRYDWEAIVRKAETQDCYYLYTNSYHAIVIPKRVIRYTAEQLEIDRLFSNYLSLTAEFAQN